MELRLLGPPELVAGGRPLDLGGPRKRVVLCTLALNANRVTSVDELVDAVWGESPPTTPRVQIQIAISALRKLFADARKPDAIRTQPPGYLLELTPGELDVEQFHALRNSARAHADAGRLAEAVADVRAALALWRGPALAGVPSELLQREATLLADHRRAAIEERIRLDLALGRHEEISGELAAMVDAEPLRERLHGFLMLALYRSGRQAEALEAARRARTVLVDELGVDPGQELRDLEHAILNRDPALDLPKAGPTGPGVAATVTSPARQPTITTEHVVIPRQLPASIADFTGREAHLAEIRGILGRGDEADAAYAMRIVAVSGRGGVGKSSLAVRAAHELADEFPDGQLYADMRTFQVDGGTPRLLARFLRALGLSGTAVPEDAEERAEMYRTRLAQRRILVVLDDVADEERVLPLLPGNPDCAVITTSRTRLSGLPGAHWVNVDSFDAEQSLNLLTRIVGQYRVRAEPEACADLVNLCDGLPLALRIAGARLASRPHWRVEDLVRRLSDESRRLDEFVHRGLELRSNIALTYRNLTGAAQRLFRLFAMVRAPDFPGWAAAALLDTSLAEAEDVLDNLVDARVLEAVRFPSERVHRYRFHDLVRVYAQEQLAETESAEEQGAALGRYLGAWLALAEEAHRKEYGGHYTVLHGSAPRWSPPDAPLPDRVGDPTQWWERERRGLVPAIRQAAAAGMDELCWDLALTSVTLFETKGYFDDWLETAQLAREVTEGAGNRRGLAASLLSLGTLHMAQKRLADAEDCFTTAIDIFDALSDVHGCALVQRNAAFVSRLRGDTRTMRTRYYSALVKMHQVGDLMGEAHILSSLAKVRIDAQFPEAAEGMLDEALRLCQQAGCLRVEAQVTYRIAELHVSRDDLEAARQALHRTLRVVRDLGDRIGEAYALHLLGVVRHREGRLDNAHTTLAQALTLARQVGDRWIEAQSLYELGATALARGVPTAAAGYLAEARELFEKLDSALWQAKTLLLRSEVHLATRENQLAGEEVSQAVALLSTVDSPEAIRLLVQLTPDRVLRRLDLTRTE
ncbi:MAG TPA: BTAD domain-containing putative transcriptional regulator [Actinophytocola sp.]|uniref:AfsR/SARP family transcriptional regulator n=1 Tax=Actinophytocola sp. TaxID=1872138 RepID=UPI002E02813B|nr:BTAD domain-containing putative transcriptional regulator [Actinophytocola sp.]